MRTYYVGRSYSGIICVRTRLKSIQQVTVGEPIRIRASNIDETYRIARDTMMAIRNYIMGG